MQAEETARQAARSRHGAVWKAPGGDGGNLQMKWWRGGREEEREEKRERVMCLISGMRIVYLSIVTTFGIHKQSCVHSFLFLLSVFRQRTKRNSVKTYSGLSLYPQQRQAFKARTEKLLQPHCMSSFLFHYSLVIQQLGCLIQLHFSVEIL